MVTRLRRWCRHGLAALGVAVLAVQLLVVGIGAGSQLCLDPACWTVAAAEPTCCDAGCAGETPPAQPSDDPCDCRWLPLPDGPLAEFALGAVPPAVPASTAAYVPWPRIDGASRAPSAAPPRQARPPPHLAALRCTVLTC